MYNNLEHDHEHVHTHSHNHEHEELGEITKEERTLQILLAHWVEHNKSHEETFLEWIMKAKELGKEETAECIEKAIEYMKMADKMLLDAREKMSH
jgi:hypothetical protein